MVSHQIKIRDGHAESHTSEARSARRLPTAKMRSQSGGKSTKSPGNTDDMAYILVPRCRGPVRQSEVRARAATAEQLWNSAVRSQEAENLPRSRIRYFRCHDKKNKSSPPNRQQFSARLQPLLYHQRGHAIYYLRRFSQYSSTSHHQRAA